MRNESLFLNYSWSDSQGEMCAFCTSADIVEVFHGLK